jgi:hypothetical protein
LPSSSSQQNKFLKEDDGNCSHPLCNKANKRKKTTTTMSLSSLQEKKIEEIKKEEKGRSLPSNLSSCHWAEAPISLALPLS